MMQFQQAPKDAETVPVHLQVVDVHPKRLTLQLPDYLPASDLTQRIARDAELEAFWPDKTRRIYYLRARGRLMQPTERLKDLGIVPYELLHLLPEPPKDSGILERPPEYPANMGYTGAGNANIATGIVLIFTWTVAWSLALTVDQSPITGLFPGIGLSLICLTFARHMWGGLGSAIRVPVTGFVLFVAFLGMASAPPLLAKLEWQVLAVTLGPAFIAGVVGILLGWLAWYGAVEPLPPVSRKEVENQVANVTFPCGICGGQVAQDVRSDCVFGCGRVFHRGCYEAKQALGRTDTCTVCGYQPA